YHDVEASLGEHLRHRGAIGDVDAVEGEALPLAEQREPRFLQLRIVVVVDDVEADDLVAALEQLRGGVEADEPGGAGDQEAFRHEEEKRNSLRNAGIQERMEWSLPLCPFLPLRPSLAEISFFSAQR